MNEIVYNILRKCVECPERITVQKNTYYHMTYLRFKLDGKYLSTLKYNADLNKYSSDSDFRDNLTDKECRRILRGMEHVQAMKIRNL